MARIAIIALVLAICAEGYYAYRLTKAFNTVDRANTQLFVGLMVCLKQMPNPLDK